MNRRKFLRGLGGACLAAPFLPSVNERMAKAQGVANEPPLRVIYFYTHFGVIMNHWLPEKEDGVLDASSFAGKSTEVLGPLASKILCLRGLRSYGGYVEFPDSTLMGLGAINVDPHEQANGAKLTCSLLKASNNRVATGMSIDHEIANQLHPTRKPLVLSCGPDNNKSPKDVISFSEPLVQFPATSNPNVPFNELTGLFQGGTVNNPDDYQAKRGKSILDLVSDDLDSYSMLTMSGADKKRISDWKDLLTDTTGSIGEMNAQCSREFADSLISADDLKATANPSMVGAGLATGFTLGSSVMFKIMALNMICDSVRSLIFQLPGYVVYNWDGVVTSKDHHGLSHRVGSCAVGGNCYVDSSGVGVIQLLKNIDKWIAKKYFEMINLFDSIDEGDSQLLDNTATVWLHEMSDGGSHDQHNLPTLIAGGLGGKLKRGVIVNVEGKPLGLGNSEKYCVDDINGSFPGSGSGSNSGNVPINKLHVTLANAVGCQAPGGGPMAEWGQFDSTGGPAAGITKPGELTEIKNA